MILIGMPIRPSGVLLMQTKTVSKIEATTIDVEQMVLGRALHAPRVMDGWSIREEHFGEPLHQEIFRLLTTAHAAGQEIHHKIIAARLAHALGTFLAIVVAQRDSKLLAAGRVAYRQFDIECRRRL